MPQNKTIKFFISSTFKDHQDNLLFYEEDMKVLKFSGYKNMADIIKSGKNIQRYCD